MQLYMLLRNHFGNAFTVESSKLLSEEVAQPVLKKGNSVPHKEQPNMPSGCPESPTKAIANWTSIEMIVD